MGKEPQKKIIMVAAAIFLGGWGVHALMMGYKNWWYRIPVTLLTCGFGGGLWALYDTYMIFTNQMKMADGKDLLE